MQVTQNHVSQIRVNYQNAEGRRTIVRLGIGVGFPHTMKQIDRARFSDIVERYLAEQHNRTWTSCEACLPEQSECSYHRGGSQ